LWKWQSEEVWLSSPGRPGESKRTVSEDELHRLQDGGDGEPVALGVPSCRGAFTPSTRVVSGNDGRGWFFFDFEAVRTVSSEYDAPRRSLSKKPEEAWGGKCSCGSNKVKRFGVKGGPRTACIECKSENMINLTTKICTCGSDRQVRFGRPGGKPEKCSQCKTEGMVDLTKKKDEDPALG